MRVLPPLLAASTLLAMTLLSCGGREERTPRQERFQLAREDAAEAAELSGTDAEAARETFLRAFEHARESLGLEGETPPDPFIWNFLAYLSVEIGRWSPGALGRAVRYAEAAREATPGWPLPWINLGGAYARAGLLQQAEDAYRKALDLARESGEEPPPSVTGNLIQVILEQGRRLLAVESFRLGAEGEARQLFEKAWALLPDASRNSDAYAALSSLNLQFQKEANAAAAKDDPLALAKVFARHGFPELAEEKLNVARNRLGRTPEVRWAEARYVEELGGWFLTDKRKAKASLEKAVRHYDEHMARGERVVAAAAGYARCLRALGRREEALARVGDFPNPTSELRAALIRLRLDRVQALPPGEAEKAAAEFAKIRELSIGGIEPAERADLLLEVASVALERHDLEETKRAVREFQQRFPRDRRAIILEAGLQKLSGAPLPGVGEGGEPGKGGRGD